MTASWLTSIPALPALEVADVARHLLWAVVLAWGVTTLSRRWAPRRVVLGLAAAAALWAVLPGRASPSFWLGLAFQSPSLLTGALCAAALAGIAVRPAIPSAAAQLAMPVLGVALGWWLMLDTLALVPGPAYALGYGTWPVAALGLAGCVLVALGATAEGLAWLGALLVYALLRVPSGNVFDAVSDPWLWGALHVVLVRRVLARGASASAAAG